MIAIATGRKWGSRRGFAGFPGNDTVELVYPRPRSRRAGLQIPNPESRERIPVSPMYRDLALS